MALQQHYILLQCFPLMLLGSAAHAYSVSIQPSELFAKLGSDVHLNCSTDCPGGQTSWVTQDDSDFTTTDVRQGSILSILHVHEYHAGRYDCTSLCKGQPKKASARLNVFSFSDPVLSMHPVDHMSGQLIQVTCTVSAVYSSSDYRLDIKLFGKDQLSGSIDKFCDESSFCKHTLSATDQGGGERIDYTCLTEFTVSRQTISKIANATLRFQAHSKHDTTPVMNSLTSSAAALVEAITRTSHMETAITTIPTHPHPILDTVSSKGQITSSQSIRSTPRKGSTTQSPPDHREDSNAVESHVLKAGSTTQSPPDHREAWKPGSTISTTLDNREDSNSVESHVIKSVGIGHRFTTSVLGSPTQTYEYREDSNAVESHAVKSVENVRRLTTSICTTGALLASVMGIVVYVYKYGKKPLCFGGSKTKDRKGSTDELKEMP